jgi:hypothetical protein
MEGKKMTNERELLTKKLIAYFLAGTNCKIAADEDLTDKMIDSILEHFELKRKKLKVNIDYTGADYRINLEYIFKTKQEAIDFCNEHGLEVN